MTKIDESETVPVGTDLREALRNAATPMGALVATYNHSPHPALRHALNRAAMRVLTIDMRAFQELAIHGLHCDRDVIDGSNEGATVRAIFSSAMDKVADESPADAPTATVRQIGEDVADVIDAGIKRVLFDDDVLVRREAVNNIVNGHAQMMAGLADLALTEEEKAEVEEKNNAAN